MHGFASLPHVNLSIQGPNFPVSGAVEADSDPTAREKVRRWHPDEWAAQIAGDASLDPQVGSGDTSTPG